jgi:hypothetical protein
MTPRSKWTLAAVGATAVVGWLALVPPWRDAPETANAPATSGVASNTVRSAPPPSAAAPQAASPATAAAPSADPDLRATTLQALASDNSGDRIEALRAVRDRHADAL